MKGNQPISKHCVATFSSSILRTLIWAMVLGVVSVNILRQERDLHWMKYTPLKVDELDHVSRQREACSNTRTNVDEDHHDKLHIPKDHVSGTIATSEKAEYVIDLSHGIEPIYLDLLQKAKRRSALDLKASHTRGDKGVVIGPTEGKFTYTLEAMMNAKRIRYILGDNSIKVALMTSKKHIEIIQEECSFRKTTKKFEFACRLWANGTLFDDVIETKDGEFKSNDNHTGIYASSNHWLKALAGYRHAPYTRSLFLDSDAFPCPGFQDLFSIVKDPDHGNNPWQLTSSRNADVAMGIDQYTSGDDKSWFWTPGDATILSDFETFRERNTGTVLFNFESQLAHTFAHYIPLVSEHAYNNVATPIHKVVNDQCPFRIALYLFKRLHPDFNEQIIPMHSSCRAYPGQDYAGTDGFLVGMLPRQQDGEYCSECSCSPCRVAHFGDYKLYINGKMGWEKSIDVNLNKSNL